MLPQKTRHLLYAVLLVLISICCFHGTSKKLKRVIYLRRLYPMFQISRKKNKPELSVKAVTVEDNVSSTFSSSMFMTIIQGADEEVVCPNDGSTLAKFFLCGTSDIRTLSLSQSGGSYEWQRLDTNTCAPTVVEDCPTINAACTWNTVGTGATFSLSSAGEFRVRVDSGSIFLFLNPHLTLLTHNSSKMILYVETLVE